MKLTVDPTKNFHQMDIFSVQAHKTVIPAKAALQAKVYNLIKSKGFFGATCDEIEIELGLAHQTASARLTELKANGLVKQGEYPNDKRKTRSGRNAAVMAVR